MPLKSDLELYASNFYPKPPGLFFFRKHHSLKNFGDELSKILTNKILGLTIFNIITKQGGFLTKPQRRLLSIGSILHFANNNDTIWGTGVNGKMDAKSHDFKTLDVRAVRGPLTRQFLREKGVDCPEIFGDPGLLLPLYYKKELFLNKSIKEEYIVIPNFNDMQLIKNNSNIVSPLLPWHKVIERIVNSKLVIASSLHGVIMAEAYGVPAMLLLPEGHAEDIFKYQDYYLGTSREEFPVARSIDEALTLSPLPSPNIDLRKLLDVFPFDFFLKRSVIQ